MAWVSRTDICACCSMSLTEFRTPKIAEGAEATLRHVLDSGVTLLNTAAFYGAGENEKLIGVKLLSCSAMARHDRAWGPPLPLQMPAGRVQGVTSAAAHCRSCMHAGRVIKDYPRDRVQITTKFGVGFGPSGEFRFDYSAAAARAACEGSLERLGVDYLDMFLMRGPCKGAGGLVEAVTAMKASPQSTTPVMGMQAHAGETQQCGSWQPECLLLSRWFPMRAAGAGAGGQG